MGLEKAILSGKEHRRMYGTLGEPYCKAVDKTCRNHGGRPGGTRKQCPWCLGNRTAKNNAKKELAEKEIKNFKKGIDNN